MLPIAELPSLVRDFDRQDLRAEIVSHPGSPEGWAVEAIDMADDGVIYFTLFEGPDARERAEEYAAHKYAAYPIRQ